MRRSARVMPRGSRRTAYAPRAIDVRARRAACANAPARVAFDGRGRSATGHLVLAIRSGTWNGALVQHANKLGVSAERVGRHRASSWGVLPLLVAPATWPSAVALATNGIEPIGVSYPSRARGGADVAVGDSALSQIDNPATLTLRTTTAFDFAGQLTFPVFHWRSPIDEADSEIDMVALPNAGIAWPVTDRLTLGAALHSRAGLSNRFHMRHLLIPFYERRVGSDMECVGLYLNAGLRVTDRLSIGGGVRGEAASARFDTVFGPAAVEFGRGYAYGGGFQLGMLYRARDDLTFGVGYRSPTWHSDLAGGDVRASLFGLLPIELGRGNLDEVRLPQRISAGVAWDATDRLKLVGEVRWLGYSRSSMNNLTVATDGWVDLRAPLPLGYRDLWVFAIGAEYRLSPRWTAAIGYNASPAPVGRSSLLPMGSTITRQHITVGLRYARDHWWVGAGYMLGLPETMRGTGWSRIPLGEDYAFSEIKQTQHSLIFGFGFAWGD